MCESLSWKRLLWRVGTPVTVIAIASFTSCRSEPALRIPLNCTTVEIGENGKVVRTKEWVYGEPQKVPGGSDFIVPIQAVWRGEGDYLQTANLLYVDNSLQVTRWLLPDNKHSVHWEWVGNGQLHAILYEVRDQKFDGERETKMTDRLSLCLCRIDCTSPTKVLTDITRVIGDKVTEDGYLLVFYVKDAEGYATKIRLADFSVVRTVLLKLQEGNQ